MKSTDYYYSKWRTYSIRFILIVALLANSLLWSLVAILFGHVVIAIWLICAAGFLTMCTVIKYHEVTYFYEKYQRSLPDDHQDNYSL